MWCPRCSQRAPGPVCRQLPRLGGSAAHSPSPPCEHTAIGISSAAADLFKNAAKLAPLTSLGLHQQQSRASSLNFKKKKENNRGDKKKKDLSCSGGAGASAPGRGLCRASRGAQQSPEQDAAPSPPDASPVKSLSLLRAGLTKAWVRKPVEKSQLDFSTLSLPRRWGAGSGGSRPVAPGWPALGDRPRGAGCSAPEQPVAAGLLLRASIVRGRC